MKPPETPDEHKRLHALDAYQIMDTPAEQAYDDLLLLACAICG